MSKRAEEENRLKEPFLEFRLLFSPGIDSDFASGEKVLNGGWGLVFG